MATIGVPTICMILLFLLPLYDRSPERRIDRRPVALSMGIFVIVAMAFLTYSGANTGSPNAVDMSPPANLSPAAKATFKAGELVVGQSGCLACHVIGDNGNNGPGPPLTNEGAKSSPAAIASTLVNPTAPMPSFKGIAEADRINHTHRFQDLVNFLSMLQ
jgi:ubiquinol-cytochrome c reductase cytochrome b subunit/menaquinol-cytochrome c reductase cytochrome b/c subunit